MAEHIPFFSPGPASDSAYTLHRDSDFRKTIRVMIEDLWERFAPYCGDKHFLSEARKQFHQRTWEMYVGGLLLGMGFKLVRPPGNGPDIKLIVDHSPIWIEAVAPTPGSGSDAARRQVQYREEHEHGYVMGYHQDRDKIILRYTTWLRDKCSPSRQLDAPDGVPSQYSKFLDRGVVSQDDAFVLAINAGQIDDAGIEFELPDIVRAVFPIGEPVLSVPVYSTEPAELQFPYRDQIAKTGGAAVRTDGFLCASSERFGQEGAFVKRRFMVLA